MKGENFVLLLGLQLLMKEFSFRRKRSGLRISSLVPLIEMLMTFQYHFSFLCQCAA